MPQTDLQLGGGYTYQWECAVLLALNHLLDTPLEYNAELHQLIGDFLGEVEAIHLEGKTRDQETVDLEDINLLSADKTICIQVKAKESEGNRWTPSDPLLTKALYRFYCNQALDGDEPRARFVFLSNRSFNPDLVGLKATIAAGIAARSKQANHLFNQVQRYVTKNHSTAPPLSTPRFDRLLNRLTLVEFLPIDAVEANVQAKLQALGVESWQQAYSHLYTRFSKGSVRRGGTRIARTDLIDSLERFAIGLPLRVPPMALYQLPPDITDFTGRGEEVTGVTALLEQALQAKGTAVVISAVAGMAGVGKSALAVHVAHRLRDRFPDAQLYVNLRGAEGQPLDPFDVLAGFLRALGVDDQFIPERIDERASLYRSRMTDKQALVLLDNAHNEVQVRPLLPGNPSCAVLVTSRKRLSALEGAAFRDLKVMDEDEALELLGRLAGVERVQADSEAAWRIVTLCGQLPLAIRIAGGKIRDKPHWDLETYASQLDSERRRLGRLQLGDLDVRASFALSYRDLAADDARLFRLLVLAGHSFSPEVAALFLETELDTAWEALERLLDLQLLEPTGDRYYRFHDLMRLFAQEKLEQEEPAEEQQAARSRADRWYLTASEVHFYAQAAILDRYVHSSDPAADPDMLEAILTVLETRKDLSRYFFRNGPTAAWAPILWEHRFFETPPSPLKTETGFVSPSWDVQEYLISVAGQVPGIVIKHVESPHRQGWYMARAIHALCLVAAGEATRALDRVIEWLEDPQVTDAVAWKAHELMMTMIQQGETEASFNLFRALTAPLRPSDAKDIGGFTVRTEAVSKFGNTWYEDEALSSALEPLRELDIQRVATILEEHLCTAVQIEADLHDSPEFVHSSWWRVAIEDTGQDLDHYYKHKLLRALRDSLETWIQQDATAVDPIVKRYLSKECQILRRLGLHILHRFPTEYREYVATELVDRENLDDVGIHHEYFILLQQGYPHLEVADQTTLIDLICLGPSKDLVEKLAERAQARGVDPEEYTRHFTQLWVRDRLWMLREHLTDRPAQLLHKLVDEQGEPEHPTFTRWSTEGHWEQDVSPVTDREISQMSPDELAVFLKRWKPQPDREFGPERISYKGLANVVASVVIANPQKYAGQLSLIALYRPEFACALLDQLINEQASGVPWEFSLSLCEELLADETACNDVSRNFDGNWVWARKSIVALLEVGLKNPERAVPKEHLSRVREILLILIDDPDPDPASDRPEEGWSGHKDPATIAVNHVRSSALLALIDYAHFRVQFADDATEDIVTEEPGPGCLEGVVRDALIRKLDRREDPSWAVHSVYGHYLSLLYWLDRRWVESHIDQIFPEEDDEQTVWFYVAAWDSYVIFNRFYLPMLEILRPKYERAIYNLGKGYVTQTHLQPDRGLAVHVTWEYLLADYDLNSPSGQQSLIAMFFNQAPPEARGGPAWFLWRIGEEHPPEFAKYWLRVRSLWEWRVREATAANHSTDFDDEMNWFAHLPSVAPESETIALLWPLLEALLPHITRTEQRSSGWLTMEKFLAAEVDRDPARAIRLYRLMHEQAPRPQWYHAREETNKIIEKAADDKGAHPEVLALIDLLARWNIHQFRYIYDQLQRE